MRLPTALSLRAALPAAALALAPALYGLGPHAAAAEPAPACGDETASDFPIETRLRGGPDHYARGGRWQQWHLELRNTTDTGCRAIHPVAVLVDQGHALRPRQIQFEFLDPNADGGTWRAVSFETTDEDENIGVFEKDFKGFTVAAGKTVDVQIRSRFTTDAPLGPVTANAIAVQRRADDGGWVGQSNAYAFRIDAAGPSAEGTAGADSAPVPGTKPSAEPESEPSAELESEPSAELDPEPSAEPEPEASAEPKTDPSADPTRAPSPAPSPTRRLDRSPVAVPPSPDSETDQGTEDLAGDLADSGTDEDLDADTNLGTDTGTDTGTDESGTEADPGTETDTDLGADSGADTETGTDAGTGTGTDTDPGSDLGTEAEDEAGTGTDTGSATDPGTETETGTELPPGSDPGTDPGTETGTGSDTGSDADKGDTDRHDEDGARRPGHWRPELAATGRDVRLAGLGVLSVGLVAGGVALVVKSRRARR
jgi:clumping factor A